MCECLERGDIGEMFALKKRPKKTTLIGDFFIHSELHQAGSTLFYYPIAFHTEDLNCKLKIFHYVICLVVHCLTVLLSNVMHQPPCHISCMSNIFLQ